MNNMNTKNFTMEDARRTLMNYNTAVERAGKNLNAKILSVNDDNTVDWSYFDSKQHSKIEIVYDWVFLEFSRIQDLEFSKVGEIIEEGGGIFINPKNIEKYLK